MFRFWQDLHDALHRRLTRNHSSHHASGLFIPVYNYLSPVCMRVRAIHRILSAPALSTLSNKARRAITPWRIRLRASSLATEAGLASAGGGGGGGRRCSIWRRRSRRAARRWSFPSSRWARAARAAAGRCRRSGASLGTSSHGASAETGREGGGVRPGFEGHAAFAPTLGLYLFVCRYILVYVCQYMYI